MEGDAPPLNHFSIQLQTYAGTKNNPTVTQKKKHILSHSFTRYARCTVYSRI